MSRRPDDTARAIVLDPADNVAVALQPLEMGDRVAVGDGSITLCEAIPVGHKFALEAVAPGHQVVKYGEVIGLATQAISQGAHVHVHNVVSARLPGDAR